MGSDIRLEYNRLPVCGVYKGLTIKLICGYYSDLRDWIAVVQYINYIHCIFSHTMWKSWH